MGIFYDKLIDRHKRRVSFVVLISFLLTFIFVRCYVVLAMSGVIEDPYIYIRGYHIHHLNYGIFIMAIAGFLALVFQEEKNRLKIGVLYGLGLGLTFDEFGMWLRLEDDYWARTSYDAIVVIFLFFVSFIYFPSFWYGIVNHLDRSSRRILKAKK
ncbi:MAG: hypothetical protein WC178_01465 [Candidatus Paceibacterota bacterium]